MTGKTRLPAGGFSRNGPDQIPPGRIPADLPSGTGSDISGHPRFPGIPAYRFVIRGLGGDVERAVLVVSAIAPVTTEVAPYHYTITPVSET